MQAMYIPPQQDTISLVDAVDLTVDYDAEIKPYLGEPLVRLWRSRALYCCQLLNSCAMHWCFRRVLHADLQRCTGFEPERRPAAVAQGMTTEA